MLNKKITVGSSQQADVRLAHTGISRRHLELAPSGQPGSYFVTDLNSTNGTYVVSPGNQSVRIKRSTCVNEHNILLLGNYRITVGDIIRKWQQGKRPQPIGAKLPPIPGAPQPAQPLQQATPAAGGNNGGLWRNPITGEIERRPN